MKHRTKILMLLVAAVLATGIGSSVLVANLMRNELLSELQDKGMTTVRNLSEPIARHLINDELLPAIEVLDVAAERDPNVEFLVATDFEGAVFAHSLDGGVPKGLLKTTSAIEAVTGATIDKLLYGDRPTLLVSLPLIEGLRARIFVGLSEARINARIGGMLNRIWLLVFGIAAVTIVPATILGHYIGEPIENVSRHLRASADQDLPAPIDWKGGGREVSDLVGAFNEMIAGRKRAEEALQHSRRLLDGFFADVQVGLALFDDQLRYVNVNPYLAAINGVAPADHLGKTPREVLADMGPYAESLLGPVLDTGEPLINFELSGAVKSRPNEERYFVFSAFPVGHAGGKPVGVGVVVDDVTERKRLENELDEHRERLEELVEERSEQLLRAQDELVRKERLATLGQLTATVSHELRNPLGTIQGCVFALRHRLDDVAERVEGPLERIERNIARCVRIIEEMLDYAREAPLALATIDVDRWIVEVLDEHEPSIPPEVTVRRQLEAGTQYSGDPEMLRRAVVNLVDNACQAMMGTNDGASREKKMLTVTTRSFDDAVEVRVADTGPGIGPDLAARIFEPLFSTKGFGVGLGLPIVKQIATRHGGSVDVEDNPQGGATFVLHLARSRQEDASSPHRMKVPIVNEEWPQA